MILRLALCRASLPPALLHGARLKFSSSPGEPVTKALEEVRRNIFTALERDVPETILPQVEYLLGVGVRADDLSKVAIREMVPQKGGEGYRKILHRPDLLRGKVEFYQSQFQVGGTAIGKMILRSVNSLFVLQDAKVRDRIDLLRGVGLDEAGVSKLLVRSPSFFSLKEETLGAKIDSLRAALSRLGDGGDPNAFLLKVIQLRPQVLSRKSEKITNLLGGLEAYGFAKTDLAQMVLKNPSLLGYDQKSVEEKLAVLEGSGFTRDQVRSFFSLSPKVFDLSLEANFKPTLRFFLDTGWTAEDLCRFPQILNYSLGKRIRPRFEYITEKGLSCETAGTARWIVLSDADFAKKVAKCGEEEWEDYVSGTRGS